MNLENISTANSIENVPMMIGGQLVESESGRWFDSINPANEDVIARVPRGSSEDIDKAVTAAQSAQPAWAALSADQRADYMKKLAEALSKRAEEILHVEVLDTGNTIKKMSNDVSSGIKRMLYFAGLGYELSGKTIPSTPDNLHLTIREPYGVAARIVPFNHPIKFALKTGAALIAGNTILIKPSQQTSLSALILGDVCRQVLPPGVVNIVTGFGNEVGEALVRHPKIKRIALTGSVETGLAIQRTAAQLAVKHVTLELGGKNPMIVFPDADLSKAVELAVKGMNFAWQGQSCSSTSRLLLHESIYRQVLEEVVKTVSALRLGNPLSWESEAGPINNRRQYEKVRSFIEMGKQDGARLLTGGKRPAGDLFERGYWMEPTIFADVTPDMRIGREEIFGPVLSVMKWKEEDEAIEIANSLDYGLTASILTKDITTAVRTARKVQSGYVWINGVGAHYTAAPFGGYKNSGIGKEGCIEEMLSYTEEKTINILM